MAEPLDNLIKAYAKAYRAIQAEQDEIATNPAAFRRRARLTEMQGRITLILNEVDDQAKQIVRRELPEVYLAGVRQAAGTMTLPRPSTFTQIDTKAVKVLTDDMFDDLLSKTQYIREDTKRLIRHVVRDKVLTGGIVGESPAATRREIRRYLQNFGVGHVQYANGRRVRLDDYADMAVRTKRTLAHTEGNLNFTQDNGINFVEVLDGPACFTGETRLVPGGRLSALVRAKYDGPAITLLASGRDALFSQDLCDGMSVTPEPPPNLCTGESILQVETNNQVTVKPRSMPINYRITVGPHHPMLTRRGWIEAGELKVGDELAYQSSGEIVPGGPNPDFNQVPPVKDVFQTFRALDSVHFTSPASSHHLHGDGSNVQGEVEVVASARDLLEILNPMDFEQVRQQEFIGANAGLSIEPSFCRFLDLLDGPRGTPCGVVGTIQNSLALDGIPIAPLLGHCARAGTELGRRSPDPGSKVTPTICTGDIYWHGKFLFLESIVCQSYQGDMYDATTEEGLFLANGFVLQNCGWSFHEDTRLANGLVVTIEEARAHPISHPRCRRTFGGRPDILTKEQAAQAGSTMTKEQIADQVAADEARRAARRKVVANRRRTDIVAARRQASIVNRNTRTTARRPTRPQSEPQLVSLGDALDLSGSGSSTARIKETLEAIDSVHKIKPINKIPVFINNRMASLGAFHRESALGTSVANASRPVKIELRRTGNDQFGLTAAHELGHFIDLEGMGPIPGLYESERVARGIGLEAPTSELAEWWDTVRQTEAIRELTRRSTAQTGVHAVTREYTKYTLRPREIWARSYSQYIATKSGGPLGAELDDLLKLNPSRPEAPTQWQRADFEGMVGVFDKIFKEKGWATR